MREILFRGKCVNNGDWVTGVYYKQTEYYGDPCEKHYIITSTECFGYYQALDYYEVDPETVGQFTGLTDKNGKKIFEGDILKDGDYIASVKAEIYNCGCCHSVYGFSTHDSDVLIGMYSEIIGNIHDNPELLEEQS
jgi:uncharacterized phage protein (TIGR01671 family)